MFLGQTLEMIPKLGTIKVREQQNIRNRKDIKISSWSFQFTEGNPEVQSSWAILTKKPPETGTDLGLYPGSRSFLFTLVSLKQHSQLKALCTPGLHIAYLEDCRVFFLCVYMYGVCMS